MFLIGNGRPDDPAYTKAVEQVHQDAWSSLAEADQRLLTSPFALGASEMSATTRKTAVTSVPIAEDAASGTPATEQSYPSIAASAAIADTAR